MGNTVSLSVNNPDITPSLVLMFVVISTPPKVTPFPVVVATNEDVELKASGICESSNINRPSAVDIVNRSFDLLNEPMLIFLLMLRSS